MRRQKTLAPDFTLLIFFKLLLKNISFLGLSTIYGSPNKMRSLLHKNGNFMLS